MPVSAFVLLFVVVAGDDVRAQSVVPLANGPGSGGAGGASAGAASATRDVASSQGGSPGSVAPPTATGVGAVSGARPGRGRPVPPPGALGTAAPAPVATPKPVTPQPLTPPQASRASQEGASRAGPEPAFSGLGIFFDQDWLWLADIRNMDRNYTMGLAFQASGAWVRSSRLSLVVDAFDALTGVDALHQEVTRIGRSANRQPLWGETHSVTLGNGAFTPDNLNTRVPIYDDRPYASLLYLAISHSSSNPLRDDGPAHKRPYMWRSEVSVGVLGLHVADWAQTKIHERMRKASGEVTPYAPLGWSNQISDGGEPTLKYMVSHQRELSASSFHDLSLYFETNVGYYTGAAAGGALRLGRIRSNAWSLNSNPIGSANEAMSTPGEASQCCPPIRRRRDFEVYGFAAGRARVVAYNALLQGQFRHSVVRLPAGDVEHVVNEFETGFVVGAYGVTATFTLLAGRTPEYHIPNVAPRVQTWGGLYLTWQLSDAP